MSYLPVSYPPASKPLFLRLLGGVELACDGAVRALPQSRKTRALLVYLALEGRAFRREALCELLWESTADPRAALRWSLCRLRPALQTPRGNALRSDPSSVALDAALIDVDALQVRALLDVAAIDVGDARLGAIEQALGAGYPAEFDFVRGERYRLWIDGERKSLRCAHRRVLDEQSRRAKSPSAALAAARRRVALDPLDTDANVQLLACSVEVDGRARARRTLEAMRARYRAGGVPDHALVAQWRGLDAETAPELPDKPSVAVLGFVDMGRHDAGDVLAEGLAAELSAALGRLRSLFVVARASAARLSLARTAGSALADLRLAGPRLADPRLVDSRLAGRLLGVRYLVHGTTQRLDRRVRITATLVDAEHGAVLWSEHFDRALDDLFCVQDDVAMAIAATIEPRIARAEIERARTKAPEDLSAWECYHRAIWHCLHFTAEQTERAHALLQRALALEPGFARAHAGLSFVHYSRAFLDATPAPAAEIAQAVDCARCSVELDPADAMGHWTLGRALFLAREHDQALQSAQRSTLVHPNFAQGHYALGFIGVHAGMHAQALPELDVAERLSPLDPLLFAIEGSRAISLAIEGKYEAAATWAQRGAYEANAHFHMRAIAAACLALARRPTQARAFAQAVFREHPGYSIGVYQRSFPHRSRSHRALIARALRSAGVPDDARGEG